VTGRAPSRHSTLPDPATPHQSIHQSGSDPRVVNVERFASDGDEWDAFVRRMAGWTHFHLYGWKSVFENVFGHESLYLAARDHTNRLCGILPLVRVRSRVFGHYLVSVPFLNYGGPLGDPRAVKALTAEAVRFAQGDRVTLLELRNRTALDIPLEVSHRKITTVLRLHANDSDACWNALTSKMRTKVRRPQKSGVVVRFGPEELEPFFDTYSQNMRDLGTPTQSMRFFEEIREVFPTTAWFGAAYYQGQVIAGGCGLQWADEFEITWSSARREFRNLRASYLLHWSFIERAAGAGLAVYNFGRSTAGSGTHEFKDQWGGRDEALWWYYLQSGDRAHTPSPHDKAFAWGPRVWQHLPLSLANWLGPRLVRYLP